MIKLHKEPSLFGSIFGGIADEENPSNADNNFNKTIGESGEIMSVSDFSIKGDGKIVFVSTCKSNKEVKGVSWDYRYYDYCYRSLDFSFKINQLDWPNL